MWARIAPGGCHGIDISLPLTDYPKEMGKDQSCPVREGHVLVAESTPLGGITTSQVIAGTNAAWNRFRNAAARIRCLINTFYPRPPEGTFTLLKCGLSVSSFRLVSHDQSTFAWAASWMFCLNWMGLTNFKILNSLQLCVQARWQMSLWA